MSDEEDSDELEAREAEALARAIDRGTAADDLPERELQTAALIRYSSDGGALSEEREDALLRDVIAAADKVAHKKPAAASPSPWWRWIAAFAGVSAIAIIVAIVFAGRLRSVEPTALPPPDASLLSAQMGRLEGSGDDAQFDTQMRAYRRDVYDALGARYGRR